MSTTRKVPVFLSCQLLMANLRSPRQCAGQAPSGEASMSLTSWLCLAEVLKVF